MVVGSDALIVVSVLVSETSLSQSPPPDPAVALRPVGEILRTSSGLWGSATASYDVSGTYRFRLSRVWDPRGPRVCWIMLNPSTATEEVTDPTVERTLRFSRSWGFGASEVVNVFALRATDPRLLREADDPVGPGNDSAIVAAASVADLVVAAWGNHAVLGGRSSVVADLIEGCGVALSCLRVTKEGYPGHPLYIRSDAEPFGWARGS